MGWGGPQKPPRHPSSARAKLENELHNENDDEVDIGVDWDERDRDDFRRGVSTASSVSMSTEFRIRLLSSAASCLRSLRRLWLSKCASSSVDC